MDFISDLHNIFKILDSLSAMHLPDLRDMKQAIFTWEEIYECAEGSKFHNGSVVTLANFWEFRISNRDDLGLSGICGGAICGADVDSSVIFNSDLSASFILNLVDDLALRPMTAPI